MSQHPYVEMTNQQDDLQIDMDWLHDICLRALKERKDCLRLSVVLVNDAYLRKLHKEFLNDDTQTDVITFDLRENASVHDERANIFDAELIISAQRAKQIAAEKGIDVKHELALYIVHGILHLSGLRDKTQQQQQLMRKAEKDLLQRLGIPHVF